MQDSPNDRVFDPCNYFHTVICFADDLMALVTTSTSFQVTSPPTNHSGTCGVIERQNQLQVRQRRLQEVQSGISVTRYRLYHASKETVRAGHMENSNVRVAPLVSECSTLPPGHLGRQLEIFYSGDDFRLHEASGLDASKCNKLKNTTHEDDDCSTNVLPLAAQADPIPVQHTVELSLPPILSPTVWRDSDPVVDPAFIREPEVSLCDLPSPGIRFPLLNRTRRGPQVKAGRDPPAAETLVHDRRNANKRSRARPLCPTSNCRLISLSWDEMFFIDDSLIDKSTGVGYRHRDNGETKTATTSMVSTNGFPKRRPIPAREKCTISDDFDAIRYRKHWKELAHDRRRFSDNDWKRENTELLMKNISSLL